MTEPPAERFADRRRQLVSGVDWVRVLAYRLLPGLALVLALTGGALRWFDSSIRILDTARAESVQAATDSAIAILSYRPDTVEQDVAEVQRLVTGGLRDRLAELARDRVIPDAKMRQATATADVPAAAAVSATGDHAVVLVFVDQIVTAGSGPAAEIASSYRVTMDKVDGRWLVAGFDPA